MYNNQIKMSIFVGRRAAMNNIYINDVIQTADIITNLVKFCLDGQE